MNHEEHTNDLTKRDAIFSAAFQAVIRNTADVMYVKDAELRYVALSEPCVKLLGKSSADEIIGKTDDEMISNQALVQRYRANERAMLAGKHDLSGYIEQIPGEPPQYALANKSVLLDEREEPLGILCILRDVTREYIARQHYQQALQMLFHIPEDVYVVIFIDIDDWCVIGRRRQLVRDNTLPVCGTVDSIRETILAGMVNSQGEEVTFYNNFCQRTLREIYQNGQNQVTLHYPWRFSDGAVRWLHDEVRFLMDVERGHLCATITFRDIDREKQAEQELAVSAHMDRMTMLLNRETTMRRIRKTLANQTEEQHALFILDLDNFKMLNDTHGHQAGDAYLIQLAQILRDCFREEDIVGRVGGDEFFVLMKNLSDIGQATNLAQTLLERVEAVGEAYPSVPLSASIGISLFPQHGTTLEELYQQSDAALYRVKKGGKNRYALPILELPMPAAPTSKGGETMTLKQFYDQQNGDYQDVIERLHSEEIVMNFLKRFAEDSGFEKLEQAIADNNQKEAFAMIHTFKGTCVNLGLETLAQSARALTEALRGEIAPNAKELFHKTEEAFAQTVSAIRAIHQ